MARRPVVEYVPATRVVHYVDTAPQTVAPVDKAELIVQQQKNEELYLRWKIRQAEIAERDRKFRRFWLSFGAVIGLAFLAVIGVGVWLVWHVLAALGLGVLAIPVVIAGISALALGGHRCITIVQHMH